MAAGEIWIPPFDRDFVDPTNPFDVMLEIQRIIDPIKDPQTQFDVSQKLYAQMMPRTTRRTGLDNALVASSRSYQTAPDLPEGSVELRFEQAVVGEIKSFISLRQPIGRQAVALMVKVVPKYGFSLAMPTAFDQLEGLVHVPIDRVHYIELGEAAA